MKLLLIYPPQKNFSVSKIVHHITAEESGLYPPLGLIAIATSVISKGKHEVKVLDTIAENLEYSQIEDYLIKEKPDVVGITFITDYLRDALLVAKTAKKVNAEIKVIAGGHHAGLFPRETVNFKEVDYVVMGDGDYVINEILDYISENKPLDNISGIVTKTNCNNSNLEPLLIDDLNKLPILKRNLVNYKLYKSVIAKAGPITTFLTSRGCPFQCPYCSGGGIALRSFSPRRIADEVESCLALGINDILFFDEHFALSKKRAISVCDELINRSLKFRWHARARIDSIDHALVVKMKKAGCRLLQLGIETGSERIQGILKRNFKLDKIIDAIKEIKNAGILTYGNFMFNSPTETIDEMNQTIDFAIKIDLDFAVFGVMSLLPETEIYRQALNDKQIKVDFWRHFAEDPLGYFIDNVYSPGKYSQQELNNMVEKAYNKFYLRPGYIVKSLFRDESFHQKCLKLKSGLKVIKRFMK